MYPNIPRVIFFVFLFLFSSAGTHTFRLGSLEDGILPLILYVAGISSNNLKRARFYLVIFFS